MFAKWDCFVKLGRIIRQFSFGTESPYRLQWFPTIAPSHPLDIHPTPTTSFYPYQPIQGV